MLSNIILKLKILAEANEKRYESITDSSYPSNIELWYDKNTLLKCNAKEKQALLSNPKYSYVGSFSPVPMDLIRKLAESDDD